uniref:Uncharacterized protein n=1 Tax=Arundo donax TaxID=35708 RepID=A0A0A9E444_ARUDO
MPNGINTICVDRNTEHNECKSHYKRPGSLLLPYLFYDQVITFRGRPWMQQGK